MTQGTPIPSRVVRCDYCQHHAQLVDSADLYGGRSFGYVWVCRPCDAYVGVHKNSPDYAPLGRLANAELRTWKKRAHSIFDLLWKTPNGMGRRDAYRELQYAMQMDAATAHIGMFDVDQCRRAVRYFEVFTPAFLRTRNTSTARRAVVDAGRFGHAGDPV